MTTKHHAPSMTFTESEVRLPKRGTVGVTKTGMLLPATKGYGNVPINIRSESELLETFGYPTEYNYKDWFNAAGYLNYSSELYVIRPVNTTWTNAGIAISNPSSTLAINSSDRGSLYNEDKAESTIDNADGEWTANYLIEFFNKTVTTDNDIAVSVCSNEDDWDSPIFTETATYINTKVVVADATSVDLQEDGDGVCTADVNGESDKVIPHGYTIVQNGGVVYYLNKNAVGGAAFEVTGDTITSSSLVYLEDDVYNQVGTLNAVTTGDKTFTPSQDANGATYQPPFNNVLKYKNTTLGIVDYVVPQYMGSSLYNSTTKLPVNFSNVIKTTPDFLRLELGVVILKKDSQGYWQLAETHVGSWDETAKTTSGLSKHIKKVINKDSKYVYCHAVDVNDPTAVTELDFSTTTKSIREMILLDAGTKEYSAPWTGSTLWNGEDKSSVATGELGTTTLEASAEIFGLNGLMQPELLISFNNGRISGYLDTMSVIAEQTGMSVALVSLHNNESTVGSTEELLNSDVINTLGNQRDDTSTGALTEFNSYTMAFGQMKYFYDKYNDKYRWVPIEGDMAGLLTRNDIMYGVQSPLAGYTRGAYNNFAKLFTKGTYDQDELSKNGINQVIYDYDNKSWLLFEFLTNTQLDLIVKEANVRRMIIYIKQFLKRVLKGNYFEFNNTDVRNITLYKIQFLFEGLKKSGGLYDYKLTCDETNNTPERINNNEFVLDIRLQPNRVIKHIIVNIVNYDKGINIQELSE